MKNYIYHITLVMMLLLTGCDDYLDVVPTEDIDDLESDFEKKEDADTWLQSCYLFMTTNAVEATGNPAMFGADEYCGGDYVRNHQADKAPALFIGDGLQGSNSPYCNVWHKNQYYAAIRYCNIFFEHIDDVYNLTDGEKKIWKAEVKAVKAFYYFDLMRRYGPIVLVPENIEANVGIREMQQSRRPIDECVEAIVKLCDEAIEDLPLRKNKTQDRWNYFSKEGAATIKAEALLFAASPLFNGNAELQNFTNRDGEQLFPAYDKEKWKRAAEAADAAIEICKEGGLKLNSGSNDRPTKMLNTIEDIENCWAGAGYKNPEAIMTVKDENLEERLFFLTMIYAAQADYAYYDKGSIGCLGAPMKMVEMYYTDHGLPITEDRQWVASMYSLSKESDERYRNVVPLNEDILSLHRRREPRFYASIAGDRMYWYRNSSTGSNVKYDALLMKNRQGETTGTKIKRIDEGTPQNITGYWIKKNMNPEVAFYNYTDNCRNQNMPKYLFRLAELYLASAEAWNEYLDTPNEHVYDMIDQVRERAGIPKVYDAWKSYAKDPSKVDTRAGMREIIQREWNIEFAFEGRRFWNVRRWLTAADELNTSQYGWNVTASDQAAFYCNYEGPKVVWKKRSFIAPRDYFFPIRAEEILVSGIKQNPGW